MGLFSNLKKAIFAKKSNKARANAKTKPSTRPAAAEETPSPIPSQEAEPAPSDAALSPGTTIPVSTGASAQETPERMSAEELAAELDQSAKEHPEDLQWRTSIVDLMKLVDMDSSYAERKEMALDLGYSQEDIDSKGSGEMNMWLHKKVLEKLSEDTDGNLVSI
ncbi:DUF3597 domain-containing protein [Luteolibacter sp. AS25]|uniref:DUF3597 domain-containing protein n=1 Tax=Luteolibacter sp. AS25 TaxID=3135776 RepID=UPI00398B4AD5